MKRIIILSILLIFIIGCIQPVEETKESSFKEILDEQDNQDTADTIDTDGLADNTVEKKPEEQDSGTAKEQASETAEEPAVTDPKTPETSETAETQELENAFVTDLTCDLENEMLTYTVTNPLDSKINLVPTRALDATTATAFRLTFNGRVVRDLKAQCGKDALEPGESVECETAFTPNSMTSSILIREGTGGLGNKLENYVQGKAVELRSKTVFYCN